MDVAIMGMLTGIMITTVLVVGLLIAIIYIRRFTNHERMAIIEKGLDPAIFNKESSAAGTLRLALLLIGSGIGLFVSYFLDYSWNTEEVGYFSMLLIFGGLGLGLAYLIEEKKAKK